EGASRDLRDLVAELEAKIGTDFSAALERVNGELKRYAHQMLEGGRIQLAPLRLPERDEIVDELAERREGIEIEVSLPKKKLKGLEALSGGERSLVSIAILFALIAMSPPPFLVLDEIDAHLDERNARRFGELLRSLSERTQFVVVTHNRATMEAAHALYGITMAEDGSSKVVSLKLEG
ncbi:MAG: AAA family ATPase, partial [Candidatus Colwellbacteria bacterium]|nr:AAA family ATPase [Candidatus Colwellbacteria bacterium]